MTTLVDRHYENDPIGPIDSSLDDMDVEAWAKKQITGELQSRTAVAYTTVVLCIEALSQEIQRMQITMKDDAKSDRLLMLENQRAQLEELIGKMTWANHEELTTRLVANVLGAFAATQQGTGPGIALEFASKTFDAIAQFRNKQFEAIKVKSEALIEDLKRLAQDMEGQSHDAQQSKQSFEENIKKIEQLRQELLTMIVRNT